MNKSFPKWIVPGATLLLGAATFALFVYAVFALLPLITKTPSILENQKLLSDDKRFAAYVISLEYESFALRLHGIQIALGYVVGLMLSTFGMILLAAGITGDISVDGQHQESKISLKGLTPGLVVLLGGALLIGFASNKKLSRSFDASFSGKLQTTTDLPKGGVGNELRSDD